MNRPYKVLFLCTGNSARSILAEAILRARGGERFLSLSAGSQPAGRVHPLAIELLQEKGFDTADVRSKSWDEFRDMLSEAPLDFVFTVCDSAASETCPAWPGHPATAHWGIPDPAAAAGSEDERRLAFATAFRQMEARIEAFLALPDLGIDRKLLRAALQDIGQI